MGVFTRGSTTTAAVKDGQKGKITKIVGVLENGMESIEKIGNGRG